MKSIPALLVFLLFIWPSLLFAGDNPTFENVTLRLQDGWTFNNVAVTLSPDGTSLVVVRPDGASRNLPVVDIFRIEDAEGFEITALVIPGFSTESPPAPIETVTLTKSDSAPIEEEEEIPPMFSVMMGAGVGYGSPAGGFYTDMEDDILFYGDVRIATSSRNYLKLGFRTQKLWDNFITAYDEYGNPVGGANVSLSAQQYCFSVGFLSRPNDMNLVRGYAEAGIVFVNHVAKASSGSNSAEDTLTRIMLSGQGGLFVPIKKNEVGFDFGVSARVKFYEDTEGEGHGILLAAHVGLMIPFGGKQ